MIAKIVSFTNGQNAYNTTVKLKLKEECMEVRTTKKLLRYFSYFPMSVSLEMKYILMCIDDTANAAIDKILQTNTFNWNDREKTFYKIYIQMYRKKYAVDRHVSIEYVFA